MKFKTWLPVFSGFYDTIWDSQHAFNSEELDIPDDIFWGILKSETDFNPSNWLKNELKEHNLRDIVWENFNNDEYEEQVVKQFIEFLENFIPFVNSIKFEEIVSPREYNFRNDSVNVIIDVQLKKLKKWILKNKEYLDNYFHAHYTSRDGFISWYPNSYKEWENKTNNWSGKGLQKEEHYMGAILNAYCMQDSEDDYYANNIEIVAYETMDIDFYNYLNYKKIAEILQDKIKEIIDEYKTGDDEVRVKMFLDKKQTDLFSKKNKAWFWETMKIKDVHEKLLQNIEL